MEYDPTAVEPEEESTESVAQPVGQTDMPGDAREHAAIDEGAVAPPGEEPDDDDEDDLDGDPEEEDEIEEEPDENPPTPAPGDDDDDEEEAQ